MTDQPINILIVDDEPKNLTVLEAILSDGSYRVTRAQSSEQALLALLVEDFGLIILDVRMPGMTGFELATIIKERKKTAKVPIIFLTAYYNEDRHVVEGYGTGAVDYLHKPVSPSILRSKVSVFAELHRKQSESMRANRALLAEVTDRQRAEEELRSANEALEKTVQERTEAMESLMKSEERQRELLVQSQAMQQRLAELSKQVMQAQEDERKRLSVELNEGIAKGLAEISSSLKEVSSQGGPLEEKIASTQLLVADAVATVTRLACELRPALLEDVGLIPSLRTHLKKFSTRTGIEAELMASEAVERLDVALRTALYRVAQEALTNVSKHSKATRVEVSIQPLEGGFSMEIRDDGHGFETMSTAAGRSERTALFGMRARVEMVGGRFAIESAPGTSTTLRVVLPAA